MWRRGGGEEESEGHVPEVPMKCPCGRKGHSSLSSEEKEDRLVKKKI